MQPRRRPAAAAGLHHLPDFADDDADQQQYGGRIDQQEGNDDVGVGSIRVRPVSTTKVRKADSSARPTANGARTLRRDPPLDSANDGSNDGAEVSALVIPAKGELKAFRPPDHAGGRLMHSYHNVAKLRQFHGVCLLR